MLASFTPTGPSNSSLVMDDYAGDVWDRGPLNQGFGDEGDRMVNAERRALPARVRIIQKTRLASY